MALSKRIPSVLLIDDDRDAGMLLAELLQLRGYPVDVAEDVQEGLQCYQQKKHDVVVSDLSLANSSGLEVAAALAKVQHKPLLIALTGHVGGDVARRSLEAGFDHHVVKPIDWEPFEQLLTQAPP